MAVVYSDDDNTAIKILVLINSMIILLFVKYDRKKVL